jgi:hypothetical protein
MCLRPAQALIQFLSPFPDRGAGNAMAVTVSNPRSRALRVNVKIGGRATAVELKDGSRITVSR